MEITPHPGSFPKPLEASSSKYPSAHHHMGILAPVVLLPAKLQRSRLPGDGPSITPAVPALTWLRCQRCLFMSGMCQALPLCFPLYHPCDPGGLTSLLWFQGQAESRDVGILFHATQEPLPL